MVVLGFISPLQTVEKAVAEITVVNYPDCAA